MKKKKCKNCLKMFHPDRPMQSCCSFDCSIEWAKKPKVQKKYIIDKQKAAKKEFKENDKSTLLKLAQMTFNKYIRLRDSSVTNKCISCDYVWGNDGHQRQAHASHYISTSKSRLLRFNEDNVHLSCQICNTHLSGNLAEYRIRLITKIGLDKVEELERLAGDSSPYRYTAEDYKRIVDTYKEKIKAFN